MNREIKFRAWDKLGHPEKEICEVLEIDFKEQKVLLKGKNKQEFWRLFKDVELLQFTGLKDKNGKEIYEGYIVRCKGDIFSKYLNLEVVFFPENYPDRVMLMSIDNHCGLYDINEDIEVIGNIYENSELLEVGK
jgi:uncharacterized phage protein (TIGR01671 family)